MARAGFAAQGLFVMDGSRRSAHANAYFTGFGARQARRLLRHPARAPRRRRGRGGARARARPLQARATSRKRMRRDGRRSASPSSRCSAGSRRAAWFYSGLGVAPNLTLPNDALALILLLLVAPVFGVFVVAALRRLVAPRRVRGRRLRVRATPTAARSPRRCSSCTRTTPSTLTPDPLYARFYYSHPPAVERLAALVAGASEPIAP